MGAHLRVLRESYPMDTNMTGFGWFSKIFTSTCFGQKSPQHWKGYWIVDRVDSLPSKWTTHSQDIMPLLSHLPPALLFSTDSENLYCSRVVPGRLILHVRSVPSTWNHSISLWKTEILSILTKDKLYLLDLTNPLELFENLLQISVQISLLDLKS